MNAVAKQTIRGAVHTALGPVEARLLARRGSAAKAPHIFILGAPRSGTSLFYEALITRYHFAYFSNLAHRFWKVPVAVSRLGRSVIERRQPVFNSQYGHIDGWSAPNEGGWIWQRWLEDGDWQDETALADVTGLDDMRMTLNAMSSALEAPFINKNVMHSNRIRLLDAAFPGCLFLEVRRDDLDTARSIIRARQRNKGPLEDASEWWSVRPSIAGQGQAGARDLVEMAWLQVRGVGADIRRDTDLIGSDRLLSVDYAALCRDTNAVLSDVAGFLARHNVNLGVRQEIPPHFQGRHTQLLSVHDEGRLIELQQAGE